MNNNEQQITIQSGQQNAFDINLGTDYQGISHILFIGNVAGKKLKIYKWSEFANDYFPIFLSSSNSDTELNCVSNKCIFFNQYILTGDKFKFELDSAVSEDIKIILFKTKR